MSYICSVMNFAANQCQKLPLNAKFEKVGSEKCQLATLPEKLAQHVNEKNKHQDRPMIWLWNLAAQIESQKKLTNQIESKSSVRRIKSLKLSNHSQKTPKS